jgi:hypothetical protein
VRNDVFLNRWPSDFAEFVFVFFCQSPSVQSLGKRVYDRPFCRQDFGNDWALNKESEK